MLYRAIESPYLIMEIKPIISDYFFKNNVKTLSVDTFNDILENSEEDSKPLIVFLVQCDIIQFIEGFFVIAETFDGIFKTGIKISHKWELSDKYSTIIDTLFHVQADVHQLLKIIGEVNEYPKEDEILKTMVKTTIQDLSTLIDTAVYLEG